MASLPPSEIAYQKAHINDNLTLTLIGVCNAFTGLAIVSLFARLISRRLTRTSLGLDDWLAIAASVCISAADLTLVIADLAANQIPLIGTDIAASLSMLTRCYDPHYLLG